MAELKQVAEAMEEPIATAETGASVGLHPSGGHAHFVRVVEALLFAASEPLSEKLLAEALPDGTDLSAILSDLQETYRGRGVNLAFIGGTWSFRTADDLSFLLRREAVEQKRLSKAALETLAIIAYHQPVTRAEIEDIRGVAISKGTLDMLLELGWVKLRGRRRTPGRPVTYGTTADFLQHFGLAEVADLPGLHELKGAGLLSSNLPPDFDIPVPKDLDSLSDDEDDLEPEDDEPALEMDLPEVVVKEAS